MQATFGALTSSLLFSQARRLSGSSAAGIFATLCLLCSAPALLYVGQVFPSAVASSLTFVGFVAVSYWIPKCQGRHLALAIAGLAIVIVALPWIHFKYALAAVVLLALALYGLRRRLVTNEGSQAGVARVARYGIAALPALVTVNVALIALYCRHYFGTWTPPVNLYQGQPIDLLHPNIPRGLWLYSDIFLSPQYGLLPWAPLFVLAPFGLVLLWRRARHSALCISALVVTQLGSFASSFWVDVVYQGHAFPARFAIEVLPLLALCVAAVFARCLPALTDARRRLISRRTRSGDTKSGDAQSGRMIPSSHEWWAGIRRDAARVAVVCASVLMLGWGAWCTGFAAHDPYFFYPAVNPAIQYPRLAYKYPQYLPRWWFEMFPVTPPYWAANIDPTRVEFPATVSIESGSRRVAMSSEYELAPGRYVARFSFACALKPGADTRGPQDNVELVIERQVGDYPSHISVIDLADERPSNVTCSPGLQTMTVMVPFTSNGYERTTFRIFYRARIDLLRPLVAYSPI